jgi:type VI secretion system secreted protein VgrG
MAEFGTNEIGSVVAPCPATTVKPIHWIEIVLVGEDMKPIPSMEYRVELPTGEIVRGYLDAKGRAKITGILAAGTCQVTFPNLDEEAWHPLA